MHQEWPLPASTEPLKNPFTSPLKEKRGRVSTEQDKAKDVPSTAEKENFPTLSDYQPEQLDRLPALVQRQLYKTYIREFNRLEKPLQTHWLEQFIACSITQSHEVISFVQRMDREQRRAIGIFIAQVIQGTTYAEAFYLTWDSLSYVEQQEISKEYTKNNPQWALMVAPFINLNRSRNWESKKEDRSKKRPDGTTLRITDGSHANTPEKTILETFFSNFETAKLLLETAVLQTSTQRGNR